MMTGSSLVRYAILAFHGASCLNNRKTSQLWICFRERHMHYMGTFHHFACVFARHYSNIVQLMSNLYLNVNCKIHCCCWIMIFVYLYSVIRREKKRYKKHQADKYDVTEHKRHWKQIVCGLRFVIHLGDFIKPPDKTELACDDG